VVEFLTTRLEQERNRLPVSNPFAPPASRPEPAE